MAIAFENVSTSYAAGYPAHATPISLFSIDAGTNPDRCVVLWVFTKSSFANSGFTATCGGNAMTTYTEQQFGAGANDHILLFTYVGAASGSNAIELQFTGDANLRAVAAAWSGVDSVANATYVNDTTGDTTATLTVSSATGDLAVMGFGLTAASGERFTAAGSAVERFDADIGTNSVGIYEETGAASVTITANSDGSTVYESAYGCSLVAAAGGDTTAPVLNSPVGTATGSTTATVGATTDEANGTMYAVVTTSATAPSAAQIKADQDHTGAAAAWGSGAGQAIGTTGAKTFSATGLTASTAYYAHVIHTDAAANDSNIVTSAQFTTSAPAANPVITVQPVGDTVKNGQTAEFTITATGSGTVTYQWQRNPGGVGSWANVTDGGAYSGATTNTLSVVTTRAMDQDDFRCNVSDDDAGPVTSDVVALTVQQCVLALSGAGYEFGDGSSAATMAILASTTLNAAVYPLTEWPPASAIATASGATDAAGNLANLGDDDLVFGTTYRVIARNPSDGETWAWTMAAS